MELVKVMLLKAVLAIRQLILNTALKMNKSYSFCMSG